MAFEMTPLTEGLSADFTCVWLLARMEKHVSFEVTLLIERISTDFTFVSLSVCVDEHMAVEMVTMSKGLSTEFTFVRLLASSRPPASASRRSRAGLPGS